MSLLPLPSSTHTYSELVGTSLSVTVVGLGGGGVRARRGGIPRAGCDRRRVRRRVVAARTEAADHEQRGRHHPEHEPDHGPRPQPGAPALALTLAPERGDRPHVLVGRALVPSLVLVDEQAAVEPEEVAVGAQEALDVDGAWEQVPFLVLDRAQILGANLRARLDLADVDPRADPRLSKCRADIGHPPAKASGGGAVHSRTFAPLARAAQGTTALRRCRRVRGRDAVARGRRLRRGGTGFAARRPR